MNETKQNDDSSDQLLKLTQEQINLIAVISSLVSFVVVLMIYKCVKYLKRRRANYTKKEALSKKYKNIVLINHNLSKMDLKPINQQFQINTAYSNQSKFNRLFPYYNVYSNNSTGNLSQQAFCYSDIDNGDQKNPSFNLENNIYLSKKFIQMKDNNNNNSKKEKSSIGKKQCSNDDKMDQTNECSERRSIISANTVATHVSTDSSDHRSEESDNERKNRKSQRLSVARPVSIKFNLLFSSRDQLLYIEVLCVDNLVYNAKHCYFYVKINPRDNARELKFKSQKTKITKGTTSVFFNETKQYTMNEFEKLDDCTIQLSVYNRIRSLSRKQLVGDLLVDLSRPDLSENVKLMFDEELTPVCLISGKKLVPTYKTGTLGFLKLELQLTNEKEDQHRIKVTIKNAKNLPLKYNSSLDLNKSNAVFMGHPEFYLILSLFYGQERLDLKETNSSFSSCPIWDQQIVFSVNEYSAFDEKFILDQNNLAKRAELSQRLFKSKLKHLSLQITVVKGNFYSKHAAIGQVKIGDKGSIDGILHWTEMCNTNKPITKWHEIRSLS